MAAALLPASIVESLPEWATTWEAAAVGTVAASAIVLYGIRRWAAGGQNRHHPSMAGKVALVTGANTGIGLEAARELAKLGAKVLVAGRTPAKVEAAVALINEAAGSGSGSAKGVILDLNDRASVGKAVKDVLASEERLDLLVNNAGIMFTVGRDRTEGADGFEEQFQTNVIGHALLTDGLLPLLEKTEGSPRIINVASLAHEWARPTMYEDLQSKSWKGGASAYGISKMGNILHAKGLNDRLAREGSRVRCYSLHPGLVRTELARNTNSLLIAAVAPLTLLVAKTPLEGAQTTLHLCLAPDGELTPGGYYADCAEAPITSAPGVYSAGNATAFLEAVEEMMRSGKPMDAVKGAITA